jgi:hypothetical protein
MGWFCLRILGTVLLGDGALVDGRQVVRGKDHCYWMRVPRIDASLPGAA